MTQLLSFEPEGMFRPALLFVSYFFSSNFDKHNQCQTCLICLAQLNFFKNLMLYWLCVNKAGTTFARSSGQRRTRTVSRFRDRPNKNWEGAL